MKKKSLLYLVFIICVITLSPLKCMEQPPDDKDSYDNDVTECGNNSSDDEQDFNFSTDDKNYDTFPSLNKEWKRKMFEFHSRQLKMSITKEALEECSTKFTDLIEPMRSNNINEQLAKCVLDNIISSIVAKAVCNAGHDNSNTIEIKHFQFKKTN